VGVENQRPPSCRDVYVANRYPQAQLCHRFAEPAGEPGEDADKGGGEQAVDEHGEQGT
jgi:hypothetical protein